MFEIYQTLSTASRHLLEKSSAARCYPQVPIYYTASSCRETGVRAVASMRRDSSRLPSHAPSGEGALTKFFKVCQQIRSNSSVRRTGSFWGCEIQGQPVWGAFASAASPLAIHCTRWFVLFNTFMLASDMAPNSERIEFRLSPSTASARYPPPAALAHGLLMSARAGEVAAARSQCRCRHTCAVRLATGIRA